MHFMFASFRPLGCGWLWMRQSGIEPSLCLLLGSRVCCWFVVTAHLTAVNLAHVKDVKELHVCRQLHTRRTGISRTYLV